MPKRDRNGVSERDIERAMVRASRRGSSSNYGSVGPNGEDTTWDDLLMMVIVIACVLAAISAGLGWLDQQFGWGLNAWFKAAFQSAIHPK